MKGSIRLKYLVLISLAFLIGVVSIGGYSILRIHNEVINSSHQKLKSDLALGKAFLNEKLPGEWSIREGKLYKGNQEINGSSAIVDEIGTLTGDTVTIFQGNHEQVILTIESVAAATEQAAANSSEITDMVAKTVGAVNQVNEIIQDHTGLSQHLNQIVQQFDL